VVGSVAGAEGGEVGDAVAAGAGVGAAVGSVATVAVDVVSSALDEHAASTDGATTAMAMVPLPKLPRKARRDWGFGFGRKIRLAGP